MSNSSDNSECTNSHSKDSSRCDSNSKTSSRRSNSCSDNESCSDDDRRCSSDDRCDRECDRRRKCGLKHSYTPIGIWNLIYHYDIPSSSSSNKKCNSNCNNKHRGSTGTTGPVITRPTQLLIIEGGTFVNNTTPDLKNNPIGALLSTGIGVWRLIDDKKIKLEETHIAYRAGDGSPLAYYKVEIVMKVSKNGTRARFRGCSVPKDINDPTLCTDTNGPIITFSGCGYKILEPGNCN